MAENLFRVLTIRSAGTTAQQGLYPLLSPEAGEIIAPEKEDETPAAQQGTSPPPSPVAGAGIEPEPEDKVGLRLRYCRASRITVSRIIDGQERTLLSLGRLNFQVFVTAGRLALACQRYPAASVLSVAGPGVGLAARGATGGRVSRLRGSVMVGHMRYPWIRSVSALPRRWWFGRDTIVIEYSVPERIPMLLRLDLRLPSGRTTAEMAAEICRRAVRYWQESGRELPDGVPDKLKDLGDRAQKYLDMRANTGPPDRRRAEVYRLPIWYPATGRVPFLRRPYGSQTPYPDDEAGEE